MRRIRRFKNDLNLQRQPCSLGNCPPCVHSIATSQPPIKCTVFPLLISVAPMRGLALALRRSPHCPLLYLRFAVDHYMQPVIVDLLVTTLGIIFTPRESRVVRWIQPGFCLTLVLVCWLCAGASQSAWATGDLHALRTQTSGLLQATSIPHSLQNPAIFWLVDSPGYLNTSPYQNQFRHNR